MLISEAYRAEQEALHAKGGYGVVSIAYASLVTEILNRTGVSHLLDYGAGAGMNLLKHLKPAHPIRYQAYDPGVPSLSGAPIPAELVVTIDVLEHIEPDCIDDVLADLARLTEEILFATVYTGPAHKTLSDGRNAHVLQRPAEWWLPRLMQRFDLQTFQKTAEHEFHVIAYAKTRLESADGDRLA